MFVVVLLLVMGVRLNVTQSVYSELKTSSDGGK